MLCCTEIHYEYRSCYSLRTKVLQTLNIKTDVSICENRSWSGPLYHTCVDHVTHTEIKSVLAFLIYSAKTGHKTCAAELA